jgi:hypothetical protein
LKSRTRDIPPSAPEPSRQRTNDPVQDRYGDEDQDQDHRRCGADLDRSGHAVKLPARSAGRAPPGRTVAARQPPAARFLLTTCRAEPGGSACRRLRESADGRLLAPIGRERGRFPRRALRSPRIGPESAGGRVLASAATADPASDDASGSVSHPRARRRPGRALEPSQEPDLALRCQRPIEGHHQRRQRVDRLVAGAAPTGAVPRRAAGAARRRRRPRRGGDPGRAWLG